MSNETIYTDEQLVYAATARCQCGAGYAYPRHTTGEDGVFRTASAWDCSDILTERAVPEGEPGAMQHSDKLPFAFYSVKSEEQSVVRLGGFMTTRPGGQEAYARAKALWDSADETAKQNERDRLGRVVWQAWQEGYTMPSGELPPPATYDALSGNIKERYRHVAEAVKAALEGEQ